MTARDEVLSAATHLSSKSPDGTFTLDDVLVLWHGRGAEYADSTIRTHVSSRMCTNAPDNRAIVFEDQVGVDHGRYRLV